MDYAILFIVKQAIKSIKTQLTEPISVGMN